MWRVAATVLLLLAPSAAGDIQVSARWVSDLDAPASDPLLLGSLINENMGPVYDAAGQPTDLQADASVHVDIQLAPLTTVPPAVSTPSSPPPPPLTTSPIGQPASYPPRRVLVQQPLSTTATTQTTQPS
jgi:hypothetical protein